jgi:excisionase family DNA binding protein
MAEDTTFYTLEEAAKKLRVSESTLRKWVSRGQIRHHKLGKRLVRFTDEDLMSAFQVVEPLPPTRVVRRRRRRSRD